MNGHLTLFLFSFGSLLVACSRFPLRQYHYINKLMTWPEAQQYCRQHYTDLATFESIEEVQQLQTTFSYTWAWIGLIDNTSSWQGIMGKEPNSWRWSATGETSQSGYQIWRTGEPDYADRFETCVQMDAGGGWRDKPCSLLIGFVCYTESQRSYVYISTLSTWDTAQSYCREHYTDLPVIENSSQNTDVYNAKPALAVVWIGLYRVPWTWSDQSPSSFRHWRAGSPNYPYVQHCLSENAVHEWDDDFCDTYYVALCHTVLELQTIVSVTFKTGADMTNPLNNAQILQKLDAVLRSQGWTSFSLTWRTKPSKQSTEHTPYPLYDKV